MFTYTVYGVGAVTGNRGVPWISPVSRISGIEPMSPVWRSQGTVYRPGVNRTGETGTPQKSEHAYAQIHDATAAKKKNTARKNRRFVNGHTDRLYIENLKAPLLEFRKPAVPDHAEIVEPHSRRLAETKQQLERIDLSNH